MYVEPGQLGQHWPVGDVEGYVAPLQHVGEVGHPVRCAQQRPGGVPGNEGTPDDRLALGDEEALGRLSTTAQGYVGEVEVVGEPGIAGVLHRYERGHTPIVPDLGVGGRLGGVPDLTRYELWDVAVLGAGPAGAAAALQVLGLRPGARVLLLDRANFPRDKACGDGIAPHALRALAALGVPDPVAGFAPVHRLRLRSPGGATVARTMRRPAYVVPRQVFDARLVAAACARGAVLRRHTVRRVEQFADRVEIDGAYAARAVVGADGAQSAVRRSLGVDRNPVGHVAVALRAYAPAPVGAPEQLITLSGVDWPAYAWSFPIGDGRANVGYGEVFRGSPVSRARLLRRLTELLGIPVDALQSCRAHHLPLSSWRPRHRDGRVLLAGDAASLINPFTGEGIYYAVRSGALAGAAALDGAGAGLAYRQALRRHLGRHLRHTTVAAALAGRPAMADAGVRAAAADQRVFDELVELGLGQGLLTPRTVSRTVGRAATRTAVVASQAALHRVLAHA